MTELLAADTTRTRDGVTTRGAPTTPRVWPPGLGPPPEEPTTGPTTDAVEILRRQFGGDPAEDAVRMNDISAENDAGVALYDLRESAGLSEAELAGRMGPGVTAETIEQAEIGDHEDGHWLGLLRRAALACGRRMEIRFVDPEGKRPPVEARR